LFSSSKSSTFNDRTSPAQAGSARLLPRLIAGRSHGPVFLSDRRPAPARIPAAADLCPVTGRARLSYRRAEELFKAASGGWTLHQLRHSAITHLAEADVGLALLMAKSRHTSLRSLQRYARRASAAVPAERRDAPAGLRTVHARALGGRALGLLLLQ
jgi:integrase